MPDDGFAADQKCAPFRYTRGNLIANNTLHLIAAWRDRKFFGDGAIYVSGTAGGAPQVPLIRQMQSDDPHQMQSGDLAKCN